MSELYVPKGGGVDASIPLGATGGTQANPTGNALSMFGQLMNIKNAQAELQLRQNNNALFQQQFAAKQKMGQIASQSMNQDGTPNYDKLFSGWMSNPQTAAFAGEAMGQIRQAEQTRVTNARP